jgi:hypothetical protein
LWTITLVLFTLRADSRSHFIVLAAALCSMKRLNYIRDVRGSYQLIINMHLCGILCIEMIDLLNKMVLTYFAV